MMSTKRDYYDILGIDKSASAADIKKVYRKLVMSYHPDRVPENKKKEAEEKFKEISEAYAVLSDEQKRKLYDQYGHAGIDSRYSTEDIFRGADFSDIFRSAGFGGSGFGSIFEDLFSDFGFGGSRRGSRQQRGGEDIHVEIGISLEEAAVGLDKAVTFTRYDPCASCGGTGAQKNTGKQTCPMCKGRGMVTSGMGFINFSQPCPTCQGQGTIIKNPCKPCLGTGRQKAKKTLTITIPAGVDTGSVLRLRHEGHYAPGGRGDFYLHIAVRKHPIFERQGSDLHVNAKVDVFKAMLGGEMEIPTLSGKVRMKIPAGTQPHTVFRLKGKGIMDLHIRRVGDIYARVDVEIPKRLSSAERKVLEEVARKRGLGS